MIYDSIKFLDDNATVIGNWEFEDDRLTIQAIVWMAGETAFVYKVWTRKALGNFDPDSMLPEHPDPRLQKIADKFEDMGLERFKVRYSTLANTKPSFTPS